MIQVNLVPDVKQKFLRAQRMKRVILVGSMFLSAIFVGLVVLMFMYVNIVQTRHKTNLQADIDESITAIQSKPDIDKVLTVQKQMETLPSLHTNKPKLSRLTSYLAQTVPKGVTISSLQVNFETNEFLIEGNGTNVRDVNVFADTLKNATYSTFIDEQQSEPVNAFSNVILDQIATDEQTGLVTYQIKSTFDPIGFTADARVALFVPNITSTGSEVDRPKIFKENEQVEQ